LALVQRRRSLREGRTPGLAGNADLAPTLVRGQWAAQTCFVGLRLSPRGRWSNRKNRRPEKQVCATARGDSVLHPHRTPARSRGVRGETGTPQATSLGPTKGRPKTHLEDKPGRRDIAEPEAQTLWLLRKAKTFRLSPVFLSPFLAPLSPRHGEMGRMPARRRHGGLLLYPSVDGHSPGLRFPQERKKQ
jgi:hypothetical protein